MEIVHATSNDVAVIFDLYDKAIEFQKTVFDKTWLGFDHELVETEIAEGRLWKIGTIQRTSIRPDGYVGR